MKLVKTIKDRCHECYACVRNCPARAVRVREGQAEVIEDRCINCANCVNICSQGAKEVHDFKNTIKNLLESDRKVIAGLAPSFPSYNQNLKWEDWVELLQELGFYNVYEVAWGAEIIIEEYKNITKEENKTILSSACPVVVNLVEKYYPELIDNLAPVVSPMGALVRYINKVENGEFDIVMIGPCQAKKMELITEKNVSGVLTFSEVFDLVEIIENKNKIKLQNDNLKNNNKKDENPSSEARKIPLAGGLKEAVSDINISDDKLLRVEGEEKIKELFDSIKREDFSPAFVDLLFCEGCISGVDLTDKRYYKKEMAVKKFIEEKENCDIASDKNHLIYDKEIFSKLNLSKSFTEDYKELPEPDEEEIWGILNKTNKYCEDDLLNCGACGYETCKNKARAVYQGIAEVEMCLPYLLSEKRAEIKEIQKLNLELDSIINSSYDGMIVINKEGIVERVNNAYLKLINCNKEKIFGRKMSKIENEKLIYPSVALLTLNEKRNITIIQNTASNKKVLATATPVLEDDGSLRKIIVNVRDLAEFNEVMKDPGERKKMHDYLEDYSKNDEVSTDSGSIIKKSFAMKKIINMSERIASTDSTVLITGESGTGKEVVARYIHEKSKNRNDFIKINCAAIPETLLESELFGYETGAFSGAKKEGKPGKIEMADSGTLFLDEIGELPLNMQAKLLQVIQEHKVTRIGGVETKDVDFRLIAATNRDLEKMVEENEFREDLFYRFNVVPINVPPLRERKEDIKPLIKLITTKMNKKYDKGIVFTNDAYKYFHNYKWPGNVRELNNLIERIVVTSELQIIDDKYLKNYIEESKPKDNINVEKMIPLKDAVAEVEKKLLQMAQNRGDSTYDMAEKLKVNQSTVVRKMKKYFQEEK